ncbi:MAG TPA: M20/M25/M40 family metallo-hydrolase [Actinocrinis sp.]|nr:M20/M25/M40 family metallo-hydrolase [Actinocrinis sp.]
MISATDHPTWLLSSALSIPSESGGEGRLVTFLADQLVRIGLESHVDEAGNVHGLIGPPDQPTIMLLGHIDTVPGQVPVCRVGDLLYGRGAVDAKGPFVAMACAAARTCGVRVHLVGAVGEEEPGSRGTRYLMDTVPAPHAVVIGEPSGWDGVCLGYKGRVGVWYEVSTPPLHTSSPQPSAVESAAEFARTVQDYLAAVSRSADPVAFEAAAAKLVRLEGDLSRAEAFLTCRVPVGFDFDAFERRLRRFGRGAFRFDERVSAVRRPRGDLVASRLRAAIKAHGGEPVLKLKAGTSDMNVVDAWGVPMAAYGPGDAHLDHTSDEHIVLPEFLRSIDVLAGALERIGAGLAGPARPAVAAATGAGER